MGSLVMLKIRLFLGFSLFLLISIIDNAVAAEQVAGADNLVSKGDLNISFKGVEGELLDNINRNVRLVARLKLASALLPAERRRLQNRVIDEVKTALKPYGYYRATVKRNLEANPNKLVYQVELKQAVVIEAVTVELNEAAIQQSEFMEWLKFYPLEKGQVLNQPNYEGAKKSLLSTALRLGYFDADFSQSDIVINESRTSADIVLKFDSGPRYSIGDIIFDWRFDQSSDSKTKRGIEGDLLNSLLSIKSGEYFNTDDLTTTQRTLLAAPYFANVDVQPKEPDVQSSTVTINIALTPRKRKSYNLEVGAGTDTGLRGGIGYENRRINKRGHNLSIRLGGSQIRRSANANYRVPLPKTASNSLDFFASLEEEDGDARDFTNIKLGTQLSIAYGDSFLKYGLLASRERSSRRVDDFAGSSIINNSVMDSAITDTLNEPGVFEQQTTQLLMPSFSWQRTKTDDLYFPTRGWAGELTIRGASESLGSDIDLAQAIIKGNALYPILNGRLKLRFKLAGSVIDEVTDLPESLGFLAGGDDSVRGYRFESIGALRNGEVSVAKNLIVGSIEYQHPIRDKLAFATFFDLGDAFDSDLNFQKGAGIGLRWRLPFGALRLDIASALDLDGKPLRLHFGFGTDL